jgi:hypothetical protein
MLALVKSGKIWADMISGLAGAGPLARLRKDNDVERVPKLAREGD